MVRLFRKPTFWLVSVLVLTCLVFAVINLMEVRTRTNVVMIVQGQALDKEKISSWLQEQKSRASFKLEGWNILDKEDQGTYIVSYTISREAPSRKGQPVQEGFWFRVDPAAGTCVAIPCPDPQS